MPDEPISDQESAEPIFDQADFADNPEDRCACVLLLDTSSSMRGERIAALNQGLRGFQREIRADDLTALRLEVAIVTFDSEVKLVQDFVSAEQFEAPALTAQTLTHMGEGINLALDLVEGRKALYKQNDISYYRPWILMITDGQPEGEPAEAVEEAVRRLREAEAEKRAVFFAVGVGGADMERLARISVRPPKKLAGLKFDELFVWLSQSMAAITHSQTDDEQVKLPEAGWDSI